MRALLLLLVALCASAACGSERTRIVLITIDSLRYDSFAGSAECGSAMPRMTALAARGTRLELHRSFGYAQGFDQFHDQLEIDIEGRHSVHGVPLGSNGFCSLADSVTQIVLEALDRLLRRLLEDAEGVTTHLLVASNHGGSFGEVGSTGHDTRLTREPRGLAGRRMLRGSPSPAGARRGVRPCPRSKG
jgi:hypothetical protein